MSISGDVITLLEPYRFSTPFPFVNTLIRKRSSTPHLANKAVYLLRVQNKKPRLSSGYLFCARGGGRTHIPYETRF